jgi:adenosine deaminase
MASPHADAPVAWLASLPKVELHHHFDGSLRLNTLWELHESLAAHPHTSPPQSWRFPSREALRDATQSGRRGGSTLLDFLAAFQAIQALCEAADALLGREAWLRWLERFAREVAEDAAAAGVVYLETRFVPFTLLVAPTDSDDTSLDLEGAKDVIRAVCRGFLAHIEAQSNKLLRVGIILCGLWDRPLLTTAAVDLAVFLKEWRANGQDQCPVRVVGVDIAGDERGETVDLHVESLARAREAGLGVTVHAGMPHRDIRDAVERLGAQRIGHGYHASLDKSLLEDLIRRSIHVELCLSPVSADAARFSAAKLAALPRFLAAGVSCSLSTDDAAVKMISLVDEYILGWSVLADEPQMDDEALRAMFEKTVRDAASAAFFPRHLMAEVLDKIH